MPDQQVPVMIATPLEPELVDRIRSVDDRLVVLHQPDLLPPVRFPGDHRGASSFRRDADQQDRWWQALSEAEVLFGLPGDSPEGLAGAIRCNRGLRWVQGTAGGTGEQVRAADLTDEELHRVVITRAGGVHAGPLAEFALLGLLAFTKGLPRLLADQQARRWDHYPVADLAGSTVLVVGMGTIGAEVARLARAFGVRVVAVTRSGRTDCPDVDEVHPTRSLAAVLPGAQGVVVTLPLTEETRGLLDAPLIGRMRPGAVLVNVGRGGVVDEAALVDALRDGRLAGAALDVFATEPLPTDSLLWSLPNVLLSPHTAGLSPAENSRIVDLFVENLHRYLRGHELIGRVDPALLY